MNHAASCESTPSQTDIYALGAEIESDPTWTGWERQGRPITNIEMLASMSYRAHLRQIKRHEEGCCGREHFDGSCPDGGWCEIAMAQKKASKWCESLIKWLEEMEPCQS